MCLSLSTRFHAQETAEEWVPGRRPGRQHLGNHNYSSSLVTAFFFLFLLFRAAPEAYGSSQARGRIRAVAASLHHSHSNVEPRAASMTYTAACHNTGSLTYQAPGQGLNPHPHGSQSGSLTAEPQRELLLLQFEMRTSTDQATLCPSCGSSTPSLPGQQIKGLNSEKEAFIKVFKTRF